jgi:uncharacterized repeat protein (TIGR01451 family)
VLTETLPEYTTYVGGDWTDVGDGVYTKAVGQVPQGGGYAIFVVEVDRAPPDLEVKNRVEIGGVEEDFAPEDNVSDETTDVCLSVDLQVTKEAGELVLGPQGSYWLTYTVMVSNVGVLEATGVVVTDTLPSQTIYRDDGSWTCDVSGVCTATVGTVGPSAAVSVSLPVEVLTDSLSCPLTLTNTVEVGDNGLFGPDMNPDDNEFTLTSTLPCGVDLVVAKNDGLGPLSEPGQAWLFDLLGLTPGQEPAGCVYVGEQITYTIAYANTGFDPAPGVVLTETLPAYTSYVDGGWTDASGGFYTRTVDTVLGGDAGVVTFVVQLDALPPELLVDNEVRIASDELDLDPSDNVAYEQTDVCPGVDLQVSKAAGELTLGVDKTYSLEYTITLTNVGEATATTVVVTDHLPFQAVYTETTTLWSCSGGICDYPVGSVAPSETVQLSLPVQLLTPTLECPARLTNTVRITDDGLNGPDMNLTDNVFTLTTDLPCSVDLVVVKTDGIGPQPDPEVGWLFDYLRLAPRQAAADCVNPGESITYTIVYVNKGFGSASEVVLTETVPYSTTYVGGGWTPVGGGIYTRSVGPLVPGAGGAFDFVVQVDAAPPDLSIENEVRIGSVEPDFDPSDNIAYEDTPVCEAPVYRVYLPLVARNYQSSPPIPTPTPVAFVSDVAVNPETNRVYVASPPSNAVFAVDPTGTRDVIATIGVGIHPSGVTVVSTTNKIYAANLYSHNVTAIDGDTHTRITDIVVGVEAAKVVADSADRRVYVTHHKEIDNGAAAINSQTDTFIYYYERLHGTQGRYGVDLDAARDQIFIAARDAGLVAIQAAYHPDWDPQIFKLDPPRVPFVVAYNPTTQHLFITAEDPTTPDRDWVVVLDPYAIEWDQGRWVITRDGIRAFLLAQDNAGWLTEIQVGSGAEEGIAVNPVTGRVYVTNANDDTVSVLQDDPTTGNIHWVEDIPVGDLPQGVAVDPSRNLIYVGNAWSRDLSVINGATNEVDRTIPLD